MLNTSRVGFLAVTILCGGVQSAFAADEIKLPKAYSGFLAATKALTASASDYVQLERATDRLNAIRAELAKRLLAAANEAVLGVLKIDDIVDEAKLLCEPRVTHLSTIADLNYLNSVISQIDETSKASKPDDVWSAITLLFAKYSIEGTAKAKDPATLTALQTRTRVRCQKDLKGFDLAYYGIEIKPPGLALPVGEEPSAPASALSLLGPLGALVDTILGIISPVVIGASTIVDEAARDKAIKDFLRDEDNQKKLKDVGEKIGSLASKFNWNRRLRLSASFVEGVRVIQQSKIDLSKLDECKELRTANLGRNVSGAPSTAFVVCWKKVWGQLEGIVSSTIKASNDYDLLADAGDTDTALLAYRKVTADLVAVADNAITDPKALWMYITQIATFATTVKTAFSQENRDKLNKAIDALVKSP